MYSIETIEKLNAAAQAKFESSVTARTKKAHDRVAECLKSAEEAEH